MSNYKLIETMKMVRDADNDCKRDGLITIPSPARAAIDHAILFAENELADKKLEDDAKLFMAGYEQGKGLAHDLLVAAKLVLKSLYFADDPEGCRALKDAIARMDGQP